MKQFIPLFLLILLTSVVAAKITISPLKEYATGETFQAEILFEPALVKELTTDNFKLLYAGKIVPIAFSLLKLSDKNYFVYFNLLEEDGNYTLVMDNLFYLNDSILTETEALLDIKLISGITSIQIKPAGLVLDLAKQRLVKLNFNIINNNKDRLSVTATASTPAISISSFELDKSKIFSVILNAQEINKEKEIITLSYSNLSYIIPIWFTGYAKLIEPGGYLIKISGRDPKTGKYYDKLDLNVSWNGTRSGPLGLKNTAIHNLDNLEITLTGNLADVVRIENNLIPTIGPGEIIERYIWINEKHMKEKYTYSGELIVTDLSGAIIGSFPVIVNTNLEEKQMPVKETTEEKDKYIDAGNMGKGEEQKENGDAGEGLETFFAALIGLMLLIFIIVLWRIWDYWRE